MDSSDILHRFVFGLTETQRKNEELVNCLEDAVERFESYDDVTKTSILSMRWEERGNPGYWKSSQVLVLLPFKVLLFEVPGLLK